MHKISRRSLLASSTVAISTALALRPLFAQSSGFTPDDLKGKLTPFGGERAGNASGTIPSWTGGYSTLPAGYNPGDPRPDPFADETPTFTITGGNTSQYQTKLSAGQLEFFKNYPNYVMHVYPTHRTALAPQYVYDNTYKNATAARLAADGNSVTGVYGGIPFPIPTNGYHVVWNAQLKWQGVSIHMPCSNHVRTANGALELEAEVDAVYQFNYYIENGQSSFDGYYSKILLRLTAPPYQTGTAILELNPINPTLSPTRNFEYLKGQRRTRAAPELDYDTPNQTMGGIANWDEFEILYGPFDEYDVRLIGKREMYVPYNMNKAWLTPIDIQLGPKFFNPEIARWELHRVWVVEMKVKAGRRNVDARRVLYFDEDTWQVLMADVYDSGGSLWKFQNQIPVICADVPGLITCGTLFYDFHAGNYGAGAMIDSNTHPQYKPIKPYSVSYFTPAQLAALSGGE